jgi:hypothetical protein
MSASEERVPASPEAGEEGEEEYSREPFHDAILEKKPKGLGERFKALPLGKKIAVILLIIGLIGAAGVGATIVSNILSGTTSIVGLTVSTPTPLLPPQATLETDYNNTLSIYNPSGAAYTGRISLNFTASNGPLQTAYFQIYVDLNRDGVFETGEQATCTLTSANQVKCSTPGITIPSGTTSLPIKVRFKSGLPVPNNVSWQLYVEAS